MPVASAGNTRYTIEHLPVARHLRPECGTRPPGSAPACPYPRPAAGWAGHTGPTVRNGIRNRCPGRAEQWSTGCRPRPWRTPAAARFPHGGRPGCRPPVRKWAQIPLRAAVETSRWPKRGWTAPLQAPSGPVHRRGRCALRPGPASSRTAGQGAPSGGSPCPKPG